MADSGPGTGAQYFAWTGGGGQKQLAGSNNDAIAFKGRQGAMEHGRWGEAAPSSKAVNIGGMQMEDAAGRHRSLNSASAPIQSP